MKILQRLHNAAALPQRAHQLRVVVVRLDGGRGARGQRRRRLDEVRSERALPEEHLFFPGKG